MEETVLTFLELDIDDRVARNNLEIALDTSLNYSDRLAHLRNVIQRVNSLSPAQALRVMDYVVYTGLIKDFSEIPPLKCGEDIIYSMTLISIYAWSNIRIGYCPLKYKLTDEILRNLGDKPPVSTVIEFMREEIENVGFDNAHLELLLLLEFIARLRKSGYSAELKRSYVRLVIDSDSPFEIQGKIRDEIVDEYMHKYGVNVSDFADNIFGMIISIKNFQDYISNMSRK